MLLVNIYVFTQGYLFMYTEMQKEDKFPGQNSDLQNVKETDCTFFLNDKATRKMKDKCILFSHCQM